jgi:hypothetical protein
MTEAEWRACCDPEPMLRALGRRVSKRKMLLFACACVRRLWGTIPESHLRRVVEVAELVADKQATRQAADEVRAHFRERGGDAPPYLNDKIGGHAYSALEQLAMAMTKPFVPSVTLQAEYVISSVRGGVAYRAFHSSGYKRGSEPANETPPWLEAESAERSAQALLLRDLIHSPSTIPVCETAWQEWNNGTIRNLARAIYDDRSFDGLAIVADALEDSGCTNADVLNHCRDGGVHVRGCWVVDLVLGKG